MSLVTLCGWRSIDHLAHTRTFTRQPTIEEDLPTEMLTLISSFLPKEDVLNFRRSCRSFREGAYPSFRSTVDLRSFLVICSQMDSLTNLLEHTGCGVYMRTLRLGV